MLSLFAALTVFLFGLNAYAEDISIYEAAVEVNATAADAAQAREKAMSEANRKALYAVINRISTADATTILDNLNDNQILNFIRDVSVISEKVIDATYLASLKITINAPVLKTYLTEKDAPVNILPKNHILIIPVYQEAEASKPLLWEDTNTWYQIWLNNTVDSGQISFHPLPKTAENQSILQADDAIRLNGLSLDAVRHGLTDTIIYVAEAYKTSKGLTVRLKSQVDGLILSKQYHSETPVAMETATQDIKAEIMKRLQQQARLTQTKLDKLTIVFNYNTLKDWTLLQQQIKNIETVTETNIDAFATRRAQITITYSGTLQDLQHKFAEQGFNLADAGSFYIIERIR